MAEEVEMIPVDGAEPPKASPLGAQMTPSAAKPMPTIRKPTQGGLKPGLKLPTQTALKPGLKLPTQTALKPGIKLPPKPVIRKPGAAAAPLSIPKPIAPAPAPASAQAEPAAVAPATTVSETPAAPSAVEQLKKVTQKLKGITQQIPQQAILRKTGIIAEESLSDAQKEAAKHKTARIALSDAIGVAPVKNENAPMKTIRIKRPVDIPGATSKKLTASAAPVPAAADETAPAETAAPAPSGASEASTTITQRKTLKIARPGGGAVRPTGKFGIKRSSQATTIAKKPADGAPDAAAGDAIADIPEIPDMPVAPMPRATVEDSTPGWLSALSTIVQIAACVAVGALAWLLYQATNTFYF